MGSLNYSKLRSMGEEIMINEMRARYRKRQGIVEPEDGAEKGEGVTEKRCIFCNSTEHIIQYRGKPICQKCYNELKDKYDGT